MSQEGPPRIKGWWDLSCEEFYEATMRIKPSDVSAIVSFTSLPIRLKECLRSGKISVDQYNEAIDHLDSL